MSALLIPRTEQKSFEGLSQAVHISEVDSELTQQGEYTA
jgi:hypothetical protein